ncbi:MAG: Nif3-like dinuclear metal center hexameric protein [Ginsengibacter sp.]
MTISEITTFLQGIAPLSLQEDYDNSGLIIGDAKNNCSGILVSLDVTEEVVMEAKENGCNLIVAHHPIVFKGLKKITGKNYVERTVIAAIKNDIAIYAVHTNLDNVMTGVNQKIAEKLNLINCKPLLPKKGILKKLVTFCPELNADEVRKALFEAGAGKIGKYSECSFNVGGTGTFKAMEGSNPTVGKIGELHFESETRIEVIFPGYLEGQILKRLNDVHPYEEVAYYISSLENEWQEAGSGLIGELEKEMTERDFLDLLKINFNLSVIRHTSFLGGYIKKVALCGGSGFFLLNNAKNSGAQVYVTGDVKYHEFFDADNEILLADIGHFESEQFTIDLIIDFLKEKYANFAVLKTKINTNPINYYIG